MRAGSGEVEVRVSDDDGVEGRWRASKSACLHFCAFITSCLAATTPPRRAAPYAHHIDSTNLVLVGATRLVHISTISYFQKFLKILRDAGTVIMFDPLGEHALLMWQHVVIGAWWKTLREAWCMV